MTTDRRKRHALGWITVATLALAVLAWTVGPSVARAHEGEGDTPSVISTPGQLRAISAATVNQMAGVVPPDEREGLARGLVDTLEPLLNASGTIYYDLATLQKALAYAAKQDLSPQERETLLTDLAVTIARGGVEVSALRAHLDPVLGPAATLLQVTALVREHVQQGHAEAVDRLLEESEVQGHTQDLVDRLRALS